MSILADKFQKDGLKNVEDRCGPSDAGGGETGLKVTTSKSKGQTLTPDWIRGRDCDFIGLENGDGENDSVGILQMPRRQRRR